MWLRAFPAFPLFSFAILFFNLGVGLQSLRETSGNAWLCAHQKKNDKQNQ